MMESYSNYMYHVCMSLCVFKLPPDLRNYKILLRRSSLNGQNGKV